MYEKATNKEVCEMKEIYVVGAIIKSRGKILCAQRSKTMTLAEYWEFPGGKIEENETNKEALKREIKEELKVDINVAEELFKKTTYVYDFGRVHLATYICDHLEGTPILTEHRAIKWLKIEELKNVDWAPADIPIVEKLMKEGI